MEYSALIRLTTAQFEAEEADLVRRQGELDTAQALLDRRRKALAKKRRGFDRMLSGWQSLDEEVVSGKPAAAEEPDDGARQPGDEAAA
jgi:hypothetical protein